MIVAGLIFLISPALRHTAAAAAAAVAPAVATVVVPIVTAQPHLGQPPEDEYYVLRTETGDLQQLRLPPWMTYTRKIERTNRMLASAAEYVPGTFLYVRTEYRVAEWCGTRTYRISFFWFPGWELGVEENCCFCFGQ